METPEAPAVTEMLEETEANAAAPEEDTIPELAFEQASAEPEQAEEPAAAPEREDSGFVEEIPEERTPVHEMAEAFLGASQELRGEAPAAREKAAAAETAEEVTVTANVVDDALIQAVTAEAAEAFGEIPSEEAAAPEKELPVKDLAEEVFGETDVDGESAVFAEEAGEPETKTVKVGWKAFLYFLIPGLVPGLPVFLVLFALSLVFLAIGAAAVGCAVGVFISAFIGYSVVADMLLLIGAGLSIFAIALVLMWFAIWFLTKACFGWVRLIHRGGIRFSRKEVQAA